MRSTQLHLAIAILALLSAAAALPQKPARSVAEIKAAYEAHKNEFDCLQNSGSGHFENGEMHLEQKLDPEGGGLLRIRYHDITPNHFLWNADHSLDGGKTWMKDRIQIEAHRIGPARSLQLIGAPPPAESGK